MSQSAVNGHTLPDNGNLDIGPSNDIGKIVAANRVFAKVINTDAEQQAHIADSSGDDATAVNAILAALEAVGILASS